MTSFAPISGAPLAARDLDYVAAGGEVTGTATTGQGGQSVTGNITVAQSSTVATGQGGQSVTGNLTVAQDASVTTGQGGQSVTAAGTVSQAATATTAQGSQSVASVATVAQSSTATTGQGSQSVTADGTAGLGANVTTGQGSQSVAASGATAAGEVTAPVVAEGGGGQVRLRFPKVRIATPVLPEPLRVVTGYAVTGQGGQSIAAIGLGSCTGYVVAGQGGQRVIAKAKSDYSWLISEDDKLFEIAA